MKIIILSDVHGNLVHCRNVCEQNPNTLVIQLGDLGVGFVPNEVIEDLPSNFFFFPGNHDNRSLAMSLNKCMGHFGSYFSDRIFIVSGADSKDKAIRTEGINWWPDEELTYEQGQRCINEWAGSKAEVIISHDCPQLIAEGYFLIYDKSRTRQILDSMIHVRRPKLVVFGHHHRPFRITSQDGKTTCIGLKIDETITLDISENDVKVTP